MNNNLAGIIRAVANNDIKTAKQYAKIIVEADTSIVNQEFCKSILNVLSASSMNLMELPSNVKDILYMEDIAVSFNERRYYLSKREHALYAEVSAMYETSQKLSEMGISYLNSVMLFGESGTGKTMLGKYIALKLGLPFVYMNFAHAISSYLGKTGQNIATAFDFIQKQKCVFMLDEIDAIGMKRGREDVGEMARIVITLMQALDCVKNDCIIVAATNRIDMIDKALLRRFSISHEVKAFTLEERAAMVSQYLNDINIEYNIENVCSYCESPKSQADTVVDIVKAIAKSIRYGCEFMLPILH